MFDWHLFNYTDFNKINLDWITDCLKALLGGNTNQILSKKSDEDFDFEWVNKPEVTPGTGLTEEIKQALLQLAQKVAYIDNQGQTYYQDLYDSLYGTTPVVTLVSIDAVYTQSGTVYDTDTLDSLKTDLVVTATYSDSTTAIIPAADYTLMGTLTVGSSVITVSYGGKTDTFAVTVTENPAPPVTLVSIEAVYTQSGTVYDTDTLDSLKADLVVTATYSDSTTAVIPAADYTLTGALAVGSSVITVTYEGKTDTFTVTVTASILYQVSNHTVDKTQGFIDTNIQLLSIDRDFSILFDGVQPAAVPTGAAVRQFMCANADSNWKGIFCGASSSASQYALQWYDGSTGNTVSLYRNAVNKRFRIAYVHVSGSDLVTVKVKVDDGTIVTKTVSSTFVAQTSNLYIGGGNSDNSTNWIGTITSCKVYGIAVDSTMLDTFFA